MATVGGLEIPTELIELFAKLVRVNDQRRYGSVASQGHFLSDKSSRAISTRSLLPQISALWANLSPSEKLDWKNASAESAYNMWNLFVQDTAYRLKHEIAGIATPSTLHQYKVGKLAIEAPAKGAQIAQYHPETYYKAKKVRGSAGLYEDVKITEKLALPLEVGLSYKVEMVSAGLQPEARFYAKVISNYQGRDIETEIGFDFDLSTSWDRRTVILTEVTGVVRSYNLYLYFNDVRGDFFWDNVVARHTATNWARDFRCSDVNNNLTRSNYQIETSWEEEFLPTGSAFDSVYPED